MATAVEPQWEKATTGSDVIIQARFAKRRSLKCTVRARGQPSKVSQDVSLVR